MKTQYYIELDSGREITITTHSAADAMQSALIQHPGLKVITCRAGDMYATGATFEVPAHSALTVKDIAATKRPKKVIDATLTMFDDEAINRESQNALAKAGR